MRRRRQAIYVNGRDDVPTHTFPHSTIEEALAMALHKSRWSNDDHEFDLALARERAADLIAALPEQGLVLTRVGMPITVPDLGQQLASMGGHDDR